MAVMTLPELTVAGDAVTVGTATVSSFVIVPVPVAVPRTAFVAPLNVMPNVSFGSTVVSPLRVTLTGRVLTPGAKVRTPLAAT